MRLIPRLAVLLVTALPAAAQTSDLSARLPVDTAIVRGELPNGLHYLIRHNSLPLKRAELRLVVNAGSILEDDAQRGVAHFVEHMAFNGTKRFPKADIVNFLERSGGRFGADLNAYTSFDETVYQLQIPTDTARLVNTALDILEDWAHDITFDPTEIKKERGVVIEEWRTGLSAETRVQNKQFPVMLRGSKYATRLPIGTKENLERFPAALARQFYREWYRRWRLRRQGDGSVHSRTLLTHPKVGEPKAAHVCERAESRRDTRLHRDRQGISQCRGHAPLDEAARQHAHCRRHASPVRGVAV
jgi:zinc protease